VELQNKFKLSINSLNKMSRPLKTNHQFSISSHLESIASKYLNKSNYNKDLMKF
jgi:hypothetical protein